MSNFYSVIVGIEKHHDPKITAVGHAGKDAIAFAAALGKLGFEKENTVLLVDTQATKTNISYEIKQCLGSANIDDTVFIFFSGHGFSAHDGPHLIAHDSRFKDLADTSISLEGIFQQIRECPCKRVALFLDCCHAGLTFPSAEKNVLAQMDADDLKEFFVSSEFHVAFGSCKRDEKSHWSDTFGHGIWTYHLLQALSGNVPDILEGDRYLRATNLQDYLSIAVPRTLREQFVDRRKQTPVLYGLVTNNFLIADLDPVIIKSAESGDIMANGFADASFESIDEGNISQLPGFDKKKGHFPPTVHSSSAEQFVAQAGNEMIEDKANELFDSIKAEFGYSRHELTMDTDTRSAVIRAKDFDVTLSICQSKADPAEYRFELEVNSFLGGDIVAGDEFNNVFNSEFSSLKLSLKSELSIPDLIDLIEAKKPEGISINYSRDKNPSRVSIASSKHRARITVGRSYIKIILSNAKPREFVEALNNVQALPLGGKVTLGGLLFPARQPKLQD